MAFIFGLCCATEDIPEDTCSQGSLIQTLWRFDSVVLKEVTKVLRLFCN